MATLPYYCSFPWLRDFALHRSFVFPSLHLPLLAMAKWKSLYNMSFICSFHLPDQQASHNIVNWPFYSCGELNLPAARGLFDTSTFTFTPYLYLTSWRTETLLLSLSSIHFSVSQLFIQTLCILLQQYVVLLLILAASSHIVSLLILTTIANPFHQLHPMQIWLFPAQSALIHLFK